MITLNADGHPLLKRFHRLGDEKRSVVIVRPEDYFEWLESRSVRAAGERAIAAGRQTFGYSWSFTISWRIGSMS